MVRLLTGAVACLLLCAGLAQVARGRQSEETAYLDNPPHGRHSLGRRSLLDDDVSFSWLKSSDSTDEGDGTSHVAETAAVRNSILRSTRLMNIIIEAFAELRNEAAIENAYKHTKYGNKSCKNLHCANCNVFPFRIQNRCLRCAYCGKKG